MYCRTHSDKKHSFLKKLKLFQLPFTLNIILYQFQAQSIVVRQPYILLRGSPGISSTQLSPYIAITVLFTIFTMLYYFVTTNLYLSIPPPFSPSPPKSFPSGNYQPLLCIYDSVSVWIFLLYCFQILYVSKIMWYLSFSD